MFEVTVLSEIPIIDTV